MQKEAMFSYNNAMLFASVIGASLSGGESTVPTIQEVYPTLFDEEVKQIDVNKPKPEKIEQWQIDKMRLDQIAAQRHIYLERQKQKEVNNNG